MLRGKVSCTRQAQTSRYFCSRSSLTRQLTQKVVIQKSRRCQIPKLPNLRGKPINNGTRRRRGLSASYGSKRRHRSRNVKGRRRRRRKRSKSTSQQIAKRKEEEAKLATAAATASPSQKKRAVAGLQATLQRGVRVGLFKSNDKTTASDWRPHVLLDHDRR